MSGFDFTQGEILAIDKPFRWTSFDAVNHLKVFLKYQLKQKIKIGHAGTLDPLATGLLLICIGRMTKQIDALQALEKEYTGTFRLGETTPSFDLETDVDGIFPIDHITEEMIHNATKQFIGDIEQEPPIYSAKKIDGKRAYDYARAGQEVIMKKKPVTIHSFTIEKIEIPTIFFRVVCSKGTYIRSLARDYGIALQSGAYMSSLKRTRIGDFKIEEAMTPDEVRYHLEQIFQTEKKDEA
ncbi:MAG: tRNA pseudouridine(55) synthase TruB [Bacteroidota bacterium]